MIDFSAINSAAHVAISGGAFERGGQMQEELKNAVNALRECAQRGRALNSAKEEWFEGYIKACSDIERGVIDRAFKGEPLPALRRQSNECLE